MTKKTSATQATKDAARSGGQKASASADVIRFAFAERPEDVLEHVAVAGPLETGIQDFTHIKYQRILSDGAIVVGFSRGSDVQLRKLGKILTELGVSEATRIRIFSLVANDRAESADLQGSRPQPGLADAFGSAAGDAAESPDELEESPSRPAKAPRRWKDRTSGREVTPAAFLRETYQGWLDKGLTRGDIKHLDPELYEAYAKWIKRHPEGDLGLPTTERVAQNSMPAEEFLARQRQRNAERMRLARRR